MRKNLLVIFSTILVGTIAFAGTSSQGNSDTGRKEFRLNCKKCHSKGGSGGEVTPLSRTTSQWRAYFEKGKHGTGTLTEVMPEQKLKHVQAFLMAHSADSEQPEICGK